MAQPSVRAIPFSIFGFSVAAVLLVATSGCVSDALPADAAVSGPDLAMEIPFDMTMSPDLAMEIPIDMAESPDLVALPAADLTINCPLSDGWGPPADLGRAGDGAAPNCKLIGLLPPPTRLPGTTIHGLTDDGWIIASTGCSYQAINLANGSSRNIVLPNAFTVLISHQAAFFAFNHSLTVWTEATGTVMLTTNVRQDIDTDEPAAAASPDGSAVAWLDRNGLAGLARGADFGARVALPAQPNVQSDVGLMFFGDHVSTEKGIYDAKTGAPLDLLPPGAKSYRVLDVDGAGHLVALSDDQFQGWVAPVKGGKPVLLVPRLNPRRSRPTARLTRDGSALVYLAAQYERIPTMGGQATTLRLGSWTLNNPFIDTLLQLSPDGRWGYVAADVALGGYIIGLAVGSADTPNAADLFTTSVHAPEPSIVFTDDSGFGILHVVDQVNWQFVHWVAVIPIPIT